MAEQKGEKPTEKIKSVAIQAAHAETEPAPVRHYRAVLFQLVLLVIFGSLVLTIGASRIYLGEHWASDVVGAYLLGSLVLIGVIQFYHWGKTRFFIHQPVAAGSKQDGT